MLNTRDERLSKQLGDFGESLVMFLVGQLYAHKVAMVDHVGADIIATNRKTGDERKRYAISVKTRCFKTDGPQFEFDKDQQIKLEDFAREFGDNGDRKNQMIPTVAFVCIDDIRKNADVNIDVYLIELEDFRKMAEDGVKGITATGAKNEKLHFSNAKSNQKTLQNHKLINHHRLTLNYKHNIVH